MVLLVKSTHTANFNLVLYTDRESTAQSTHLEASCTWIAEARVWRDRGEQGQALSIAKVSKSLYKINLVQQDHSEPTPTPTHSHRHWHTAVY